MRTGGDGTWNGVSKAPGTQEILGHSTFLAGTRDLCVCMCGFFEAPLTFSSPVATAAFPTFAGILSAALSQHHLLGLEIAQLEFHHLH